MSFHPPALELATILRNLPDAFRTGRAIEDIRTAYAFGFADRLWNRHSAVVLAFRAGMATQEAHGNGSKAASRLHRQRMAEVYADMPVDLPSEEEVDQMALADEVYTEGRIHRPFPINPHD